MNLTRWMYDHITHNNKAACRRVANIITPALLDRKIVNKNKKLICFEK